MAVVGTYHNDFGNGGHICCFCTFVVMAVVGTYHNDFGNVFLPQCILDIISILLLFMEFNGFNFPFATDSSAPVNIGNFQTLQLILLYNFSYLSGRNYLHEHRIIAKIENKLMKFHIQARIN
jgi:hypothetical protein